MFSFRKAIETRRKQALKKDFYGKGRTIVMRLGNGSAYDDGTIRIDNDYYQPDHYVPSPSECRDTIEIFDQGQSVFKSGGGEEKNIERYVPGKWEAAFDKAAKKAEEMFRSGAATESSKPKNPGRPSKEDLRKNWGL